MSVSEPGPLCMTAAGEKVKAPQLKVPDAAHIVAVVPVAAAREVEVESHAPCTIRIVVGVVGSRPVIFGKQIDGGKFFLESHI